MGGDQADVAEQIARRASCGRSTGPQRHLLGAAFRRTMARSEFAMATHHLLQPFRGGEGPEYGGGSWTHLLPLTMRPSK